MSTLRDVLFSPLCPWRSSITGLKLQITQLLIRAATVELCAKIDSMLGTGCPNHRGGALARSVWFDEHFQSPIRSAYACAPERSVKMYECMVCLLYCGDLPLKRWCDYSTDPYSFEVRSCICVWRRGRNQCSDRGGHGGLVATR